MVFRASHNIQVMTCQEASQIILVSDTIIAIKEVGSLLRN